MVLFSNYSEIPVFDDVIVGGIESVIFIVNIFCVFLVAHLIYGHKESEEL